jgi:hypothetical protein
MAMRRAFRITLSYAGTTFTLQAAARIDKVVAASAPTDARQREAGAWIAVEDAQHRLLYRRLVDNPLGAREVFSGDERDFRRVRVPLDVLVYVVPDLPHADRVVLYASDPEGAPARRVFTVSVRDVAALAAKPRGRDGRE